VADVEVTVMPSAGLLNTLVNLRRLDRHPALVQAKRAIGIAALQDQRLGFVAKSRPGASPWPALGFTTVVLRPGGPKLYDEGDVAAKRSRIMLLRATNRLFASLTPGAPGNVFDLSPAAVRIGTDVAYAELQQRGGTTTFKFGPEEYKTFRRNVSPFKRGMGFAKGPYRALRAPTARRNWKALGLESPWNPFYFRTLAVLRKMRGKSYRVPARPFLVPPTAEQQAKYARILSQAIGKAIG